jgi:similar to stage IV sporulation protein
MLLLRLWNYLRGYVIIIVEGYFLEKFINVCTHRQILLWNVKRQKNCVMSLRVSIRGFKLLRPVARKTGCRVRIAGKRGLPFIFNRYRRRKTFALGAFVFLTLIFLLTSFVWKIEVIGNKKIDTALIIEKLSSMGVRTGVLKYGINTDKLVSSMMLEIRELGWVGITVRGTKVKVQVTERKPPPELVPKDIPCDIVAKRDGLIKSVLAMDGIEKVKEGDTVVKGQVLISGVIDSHDVKESPRIVHAMGNVTARTWYEKSCDVITRLVEKVRTDKVKDRYSLLLIGKKLGPLPGKIPFTNCDKVEIKKEISIGEDLVLPFQILIERYYEYDLAEKEIPIEEAQNTASDTAYKEVLDSLPEDAEIVSTDVQYKERDNGGLTAIVTIECLEEIGVTKEIGGE